MENTKDTIIMDRGNNTTCTINLHGATVTSWRLNNEEQLFCSKLAIFDNQKAIRGGIPLVFPMFGSWTYGPSHGFARIVRWNVEKIPELLENGDVEAVFSLTDTDFTRSMWTFPFRLFYTIVLCEKELQLKIAVHNLSKEYTLDFNILLHTYFNVPDVRQCEIIGLKGCTYVDKTKDGEVNEEKRDKLTINGFIDNVYQNSPDMQLITNVIGGRKMRITKSGFTDTVVWNPWIDGAKKLNDFGDDEYLNMICVEAGYVSNFCSLTPGKIFEGNMKLQVIFDYEPYIPQC